MQMWSPHHVGGISVEAGSGYSSEEGKGVPVSETFQHCCPFLEERGSPPALPVQDDEGDPTL